MYLLDTNTNAELTLGSVMTKSGVSVLLTSSQEGTREVSYSRGGEGGGGGGTHIQLQGH